VEPKSSGHEAHGASNVHGTACDVERKAGHHIIHQNTKVVTKVGTSDAEGPHARQHKRVSAQEESGSDRAGQGKVGEVRRRGLVAEGTFIASQVSG